MAKSSVSMKLLIDRKSERVLYAEASKDCVDFLFYILSLPVAKLISLVGKQQMVGCLANLYDSVESLNESYIHPNKNKNTYLKPPVLIRPTSCSYVPLLALEDSFYTCNNPTAVCPSCRRFVNMAMHYVYPRGRKKGYCEEGGGFVRGVVTYMVMDDLVVKPMSTISTLTLLNKFNVKEVGALHEQVVHLGMPQAVKLLKASLETDKVLTTVFLKGPR